MPLFQPPSPIFQPLKPSAYKFENYSRAPGPASSQSLVSGRLHLSAIYLPVGQVISNIIHCTGGTALAAGSNQWFCILNSTRGTLATTTDDTSTAWGSFALKSLPLSTAITTTYSGIHYVGVCVVSTGTVPNLIAQAHGTNTLTSQAPIISQVGDTGLTNPASCPVDVLSGGSANNVAWVAVS